MVDLLFSLVEFPLISHQLHHLLNLRGLPLCSHLVDLVVNLRIDHHRNPRCYPRCNLQVCLQHNLQDNRHDSHHCSPLTSLQSNQLEIHLNSLLVGHQSNQQIGLLFSLLLSPLHCLLFNRLILPAFNRQCNHLDFHRGNHRCNLLVDQPHSRLFFHPTSLHLNRAPHQAFSQHVDQPVNPLASHPGDLRVNLLYSLHANHQVNLVEGLLINQLLSRLVNHQPDLQGSQPISHPVIPPGNRLDSQLVNPLQDQPASLPDALQLNLLEFQRDSHQHVLLDNPHRSPLASQRDVLRLSQVEGPQPSLQRRPHGNRRYNLQGCPLLSRLVGPHINLLFNLR